jgi:hypothetical protein
MIGNLFNVLIGLWLAYSAIFAIPAGNMSNIWLAVSGIAVMVFAAWARRTDPAGWQSATNLVLGAVLLLEAAARWAVAVASLVSFWSVLLLGIAIAIVALWSILYRPEVTRSPA